MSKKTQKPMVSKTPLKVGGAQGGAPVKGAVAKSMLAKKR